MKQSEPLLTIDPAANAGPEPANTHEAPPAWGGHDFYNVPAMYGIFRVANSWRVDLSRARTRFLRSFAFSRYGGEAIALACAQAYRDEIVRNHLPPERSALAQKLRITNKSGVSGVTFRFNAKGEIKSWHAITRVSADRLLTKSFTVGRYGAAQAERLAIAEREKQLQAMKGLRNVHPAEARVRETTRKAPGAKATASKSRRTLPEPIPVVEILRKSNSSGTPGVSCVKDADGSPRYWLAKTGGIDGTSIAESFSVTTHGNEKARLLAINARRAQLKKKHSCSSQAA